MKFNYQARTQDGQVQNGVVEASSGEVAIDLLQRQNLYVTLLEEASKPPVYAKKITLFEKISRRDIVLFSRQLAIMFRSKVPLIEALQVLAEQEVGNLDMREKILTISDEVEGGTSFSDALAQFPKMFSSFYIAMIKAGEASGKLSESLDYLAAHLESEYRLTSKIQGAMIYPALVLGFVVLVLFAMVFFVIPNIVTVLEETGQEMPFITLLVINMTDFIRSWFLLIAAAVVGVFVYLARYYKSKEGKMFFDKLFLKLPGIGSFLKMFYLSRFAENLSILISGGLPIAQALDITADIVGNAAYKKVIMKTKEGVKRGDSISSMLSASPDIFPPMFYQMVSVGERTGTLDKSLMDVVDFYQKETERMIENLLSSMEPILIMFLGLVVGGLMFAILMPMYDVMSF
jgi:type IV pilus assembly protein PilC